MNHSDYVESVRVLHSEARDRGLYYAHSEGSADGRSIQMGDRRLLWFGSCSYLGLEHHPALVEGAIAALRSQGTQFASSRGYVSLREHAELEARLTRLFGRPALLAQTTTLGHAAFVDALVDERDALILDHQVHASVQAAAVSARAHGARVERVHHEDLDQVLAVVQAAARTCRRVWFATDGVTSMYGDHAPYALLRAVLDVAPNVRLYVDDAHGTGWAGRHGRGPVLERLGDEPRLVVATSLAKSFAAGGGLLLLPTEEEREHVRLCGGTMVFSGPLQPPLLGAALGSAELHLSAELPALQQALFTRVRRLKDGLRSAGVDIIADNDVPIAFIELVKPEVAIHVAEELARAGFYANISMFPSVPQDRAGLRVTLTNHLHLADIDAFVTAVADVVPRAIRRFGLSRAEVLARFSRTRVGAQVTASRRAPDRPRTDALRVQHSRTIHDLDAAEWDTMLGAAGCISAASLATQEAVFRSGAPEDTWGFDYLVVRDPTGRPVAATVLTELLIKDDMLLRAEVSEAAEALRREDPRVFVSRALLMGGGLSEGQHLYLDRGADWRAGLSRLLDAALALYEERGVDALLLRDLDEDEALAMALLDEGFARSPMPDRHLLTLDDRGMAGVVEDQRGRRRRLLRDRVASHGRYTARLAGPDEDWHHLWTLYRAVADRRLDFNTFPLPERLLPALQASPAWEVVLLHLDTEAGGPGADRPVGFFAAHHHGTDYAALFCGLDYAWVTSHGAYRHLLLEIALRAEQRGARTVHFGMEASLEKRRLGCTVVPAWSWSFHRDTWQLARLQDLVERVSLTTGRRRG